MNKDVSADEEIRRLVLARLKTMSSDTIKCIGEEGSFDRDELIAHVKEGDSIGKTIEQVEMEWLRAFKEGIITELYN
ncbi:MAG: hypothetical protein WC386_02770 [Candidatus Paceibacterota bacterium]|jgi:hypothetical protein